MKEKPNYYAILPSNVRYSTELTSFTKLLYAELTALSNFKGYAYCSNWYLQNLFSVSARTITRSIGQLVEGGYVESKLIFKSGTKQVEARHISINEYLTPRQNCQEGIDKNGEDNNTRENRIYIEFDRFWEIYPRRQDENACKKLWESMEVEQELFDQIKDHIDQQLSVSVWGRDKSFIPMPTTFLRNHRWQDEVIPYKEKKREERNRNNGRTPTDEWINPIEF